MVFVPRQSASVRSRLGRFFRRALHLLPRRQAGVKERVFAVTRRRIPFLSGSRLRWLIGIAAAFGLAVGLFQFSGVFDITQVRIERSSFDIPVDTIEQLARQEVLGQNIFFVDTVTLSENITKLSPDFSHTVIRRELPATLAVEVFKYPTVAFLKVGSDTLVLNENGYIVLGAEVTTDLLPLVLGESVNFPDTTKPLIPPEHLEILRDAKSYADATLPLHVSSITYLPIAREAHLRTEDGLELWLDMTQDIRTQIDKLALMWEKVMKGKTYRYVDLRIRSKIFAMPR